MKYLIITLIGLSTFLTTAHAEFVIAPWTYGDTIGIPVGTPYKGTCFITCDRVPGHTVMCSAHQRPNSDGSIDCATQCRHDPSTPYLGSNLYTVPGSDDWRTATAGWCPFIRRLDTGETLYPACHSENYQMSNIRSYGPGDSECWYPDLPDGVPFEYIREESQSPSQEQRNTPRARRGRT